MHVIKSQKQKKKKKKKGQKQKKKKKKGYLFVYKNTIDCVIVHINTLDVYGI